HTYSLSTTADNLMAHAEELGKHLPDLFTADTIANLHSLKERSEAGDEQVAAILSGPEDVQLQITFAEKQHSANGRRMKRDGFVLDPRVAVLYATPRTDISWWRR
ncbi:MAG: hypothetical protein AAF525_05555, partial [Pseudomonadota bacterium]